MKKIFFAIFLLAFSFSLQSQTVDSIKVEQAGDFVKIRYKILNSTPDQIYKVKVLCSINGGMNNEIRSITGDVGDQVIGGKNEYWAVWDVLKDVAEITSVEFIVRAEIVNNSIKNQTVAQTKKVGKEMNELTTLWSGRKFHILLASDFPGPKPGVRISYMGSFGISAQYCFGKAQIGDELTALYPDYHLEAPAMSFAFTKRIINHNAFQMHLLAGIKKTRIIFYDPGGAGPLQDDTLTGIELGFALGINRLALTAGVSHIDPKPGEEGTNYRAKSAYSFFNTCLGLRF